MSPDRRVKDESDVQRSRETDSFILARATRAAAAANRVYGLPGLVEAGGNKIVVASGISISVQVAHVGHVPGQVASGDNVIADFEKKPARTAF